METVLHWSDCKAQKQSETLLHLDKLRPYLSKNSKITEYACGYGTLLNQLFQEGFTNSIGYDFSSTCIQKGKNYFLTWIFTLFKKKVSFQYQLIP